MQTRFGVASIQNLFSRKENPGFFPKMNVATKLMSSVFALGAFSILSALIAVIAFNLANTQFSEFNEKHVPALVGAGEFALISTDMTIAASELIDATEEEKRANAFKELSKNVAALGVAVEKKKEGGEETQGIEALRQTVEQFRLRLSELDQLTANGLEKEEQSQEKIQELFKLNNSLSRALSPLLDEAYGKLNSKGKSAADESSVIINRLVDEEIGSFQTLLELRGDVAAMGASLAAFVGEEDTELTKKFKLNMAKSSFGVILKAEQLQESGTISDDFFVKLEKFSALTKPAQKLKKAAGEIGNAAKTKSFLSAAIVDQTEIDQELSRTIASKFDNMTLNAQSAAHTNSKIINGLLSNEMVQVRKTLEAISAVREYTALVVQGALSHDPKVVDQMQSTVFFVKGRVSSNVKGLEYAKADKYLDALMSMVDDKTGLIALRKSQLEINDKVGEIIASVHTDTHQINSIIKQILSSERDAINASSMKLAAQLQDSSNVLIGIGAFAILSALLIGAFVIRRNVTAPLTALIHTTRDLADGNLETNIGHSERSDELGELAKALIVFRDNGVEKLKVEEAAEMAKLQVEDERKNSERERSEKARQIQMAVSSLGSGLKKLADGDLTIRVSGNFEGDLDSVREDFNQSLQTLEQALTRVAINTSNISSNSSELREAANMLSNRTEAQAGSIEETANSISSITDKVMLSSSEALQASEVMQKANQSALSASDIVNNAINAMEHIEETSGKISSIIAMIDEIAFQTNLLALNAGVEAARAGDAGRGFAVVAQEVRELAGRTTNAAKEIKDLISTSVDEVENGVNLVRSTGESIDEIGEHVKEIHGHIASITNASQEQSEDLKGINAAISQLDEVTQQNAAMAEETNAATQSLADLATELRHLLSTFVINGSNQYQKSTNLTGNEVEVEEVKRLAG